eukprot:9473864-Pyramimonas_sp.AAC.3
MTVCSQLGVLEWFARLWEIATDDYWVLRHSCFVGARFDKPSVRVKSFDPMFQRYSDSGAVNQKAVLFD